MSLLLFFPGTDPDVGARDPYVFASEGPLYALPSDELAATVTPVLVEGTEDPDYPLSNLTDGMVSTVFKPNSLAAFEIQWNFGADTFLGPVAMFNIAIEPGSAVKLYLTNAAYPLTPPLGRTWDVVIADALPDGRHLNPHVSTFIGQRQYLRLRVPAQTLAPASIGEIKIARGPTRQLTRSFGLEGIDELELRPGARVRTPVRQMTAYDYGVTLPSYDVRRWQMDAAEKAEFLRMKRAAKIVVTPWLFIQDPLVNDAWLVQFATDPIIRKVPESIYPTELWETSFLLDTVSGGVPPTQIAES